MAGEMSPWYFIFLGLILLFGAAIYRLSSRIPPRVIPIVAIFLVIVGGILPFSIGPWGLALICLGLGLMVAPSVWTAPFVFLSVVFGLLGAIFIFWRPAWMIPGERDGSLEEQRSTGKSGGR
jgi:hypothetical protein